MSTKVRYGILPALVCITLIFAISCQKETGYKPVPDGVLPFVATLPTVIVDSVDEDVMPVKFHGRITAAGSDSVTQYGFCFSTTNKVPTVADTVLIATGKADKIPFSFTLSSSSLKPDTLYYLRAFAQTRNGIGYSEAVVNFVVPDNRTLPSVVIKPAEEISGTTAKAIGRITSDGNTPLTAYGFCYSSTDQKPDLNDGVAITGTSVSSALPYDYAQTLTALTNSTQYYVRAFTTNALGTSYSESVSFRTSAAAVVLPSVRTDNVLNIATTSADVDGALLSRGTAEITRYGFCLSKTNANPTTGDAVIVSGTSSPANFPAAFTGRLATLQENTTYYVRAFATSAAGTAYGVARSFKTKTQAAVAPAVQTLPATSINTEGAQARGSLESAGTAAITRYGFCYSSTQTNPSTSDNVIVAGNTTPTNLPHAFASTITGLAASTQYHVRAFATSSAGTSYGATQTFRTIALPSSPPTVQTVSVSGVTADEATVLGNITAAGTSAINAYGVAYSATNSLPTTADNKIVAGSMVSNFPFGFSTKLEGLTPNTTYSVRTFATSNTGTSYGEVKRFVTAIAIPSVITEQISFESNITTAKGVIQNSGASAINRYGFCYSTTNNAPTVGDNTVDAGSSVAGGFPFSFTYTLARLTPGTYYFRAFAVNGAGVAYGNVVSVVVYQRPDISTDNATDKDPGEGLETLYGTIVNGGSAPIDEYGFCFILTADPESDDFGVSSRNVGIVKQVTPRPTGFPFRFFLDATVSYNTDYSYRAYVKTSNGYFYGNVKTFYISYKP